MLTLLRRCDYLIGKKRRMRWAMLVLLACGVGALEAVGAFLIFALLAVITGSSSSLHLPLLDSVVGSAGTEDERVTLLIQLSLVVAVFFVVRAVVSVGQTYVQYRMANNAGVELSHRLLDGYLRMPYVEHLRRNSAEMIRNAYESVDVVARFALVPVVTFASQALLVLAMAIVLLITAPLVTLFAMLVLGPLVFVLLRVLQPRLAVVGGNSQDMAKASLQAVQQSLRGVRDVVLLGRQREFENEFIRHKTRLARSYYLQATYVGIPRVALETAFILVVLAFLGVTAAVGSQSLGGALALLGLFSYSVLRLLPAVNQIVTSLNYLEYGAAAADNVYQDLRELERLGTISPQQPPGEPMPFSSSLRMEDVSYTYPGSSTPALNNVSIGLRAGESIGLVGATGGGKSTLIDLLVGLLEPTSGRITVDGVDIAHRRADWQRNLGVVSQSVFLLDDTVRSNIAFGLPTEQVDEDMLREAVQLAQLDDVIEGLSDGLDTPVGEHGVRLSGGQRQRVAIARALYRRPAVLVFDEGTSALDNRTEADLVTALERLRGSRTLITVAHRLTTVRGCDRILVITDGRIVEEGRYDDLVVSGTHLRRLAHPTQSEPSTSTRTTSSRPGQPESTQSRKRPRDT